MAVSLIEHAETVVKLEFIYSNAQQHRSFMEMFQEEMRRPDIMGRQCPIVTLELETFNDGAYDAEEFCERRCEVTYKMTATVFDERLLVSIRNVLTALGVKNPKSYILPYERPRIIFSQTAPFHSPLVTHYPHTFLGALFFGQIQGGVFLNHWEVSYNILEHDPRGPRRSDNSEMYAVFEFDRNDMIQIKFRNNEFKDTPEGRRDIVVFYNVVVKDDSIKRVIVDNAVNESYGSQICRVFFELQHPAMIKQGFLWSNKNSKPTDFLKEPQGLRWLHLTRGRNEKERMKDWREGSALVESSYLAIEFSMNVELEKIYKILCRIRARCGCVLEFGRVEIVDSRIWKFSPYYCCRPDGQEELNVLPISECTKNSDSVYAQFLQKNKLKQKKNPDLDSEQLRKKNLLRRFTIMYLIECLLSRGAIVKDQLWLSYVHWHFFLQSVSTRVSKNFENAEKALEKLIVMIDEQKPIRPVTISFIEAFDLFEEERLALVNLTEREIKEGYQKVRKIVFTPTRKIYIVPEVLMSNRVLRNFDDDGCTFLRVQFRDDDNQKMRSNKTSETHINNCVKHYLTKGVKIAGRKFGYLGSSNSQLRDHGAYFMLKYDRKQEKEYKMRNPGDEEVPDDFHIMISRTRGNLGKFNNMENVPKLMARLGQCFTQSREAGVPVTSRDFGTTFDVTGGYYNGALNAFTFTDGAGIVSREFAANVARTMLETKCVPSCYQIRFRGMKGVLAINPILDELSKWAQSNKIWPLKDEYDIRSWNTKFAFRSSQIKFEGTPPKEAEFLEVVKLSAPVPVALNKPFINILDQVSEMQSPECKKRIANRIEALMDRQTRDFASQLINETACRNRLRELPGRINTDIISKHAGFALCGEPFFRSLIKAATKYCLGKQLHKEQIQIPYDLGRSLLGIPDESGRLQYGQIFVQYTVNIHDKYPVPQANKRVLKGTVLLTKNPCVVAGDVRIFEAVDVPELQHLVDVIVFPVHGIRPHPDEMAGSDLDGDEYSVIWDPELLLEKNEDAFDFAADKPPAEAINENELQQKMADFYVKYMQQDAVGTISNAFLFNSDFYGLNSKLCLNLAKKNCMALDFTKSGRPPSPLKKDWHEDDETGVFLPPEKNERVPDYHTSVLGHPVYVSGRLIGRLFREMKLLADVLKLSEERDEQMDIVLDPLLIVSGWENYEKQAKNELYTYNASLRALMENYGIRTEAEIFTGYISDMRNRISDKDQDDMSFFNTNQMIETKIDSIFRRCRETFFHEFGGFARCTQKIEKNYANEFNVFHRICTNPTLAMRQKAVAYYRICYETAMKKKERKLSFAWVAYDILAVIKQEKVLADKNFVVIGNPLGPILSEHCNKFCDGNKEKLEQFQAQYEVADPEKAKMTLQKYCWINTGLSKFLFVISEWARQCKVVDDYMRTDHLGMLFILFCTNHFGTLDDAKEYENDRDSIAVFPLIPLDKKLAETDRTLMNDWEVLLRFFGFLASRRFSRLQQLDFSPLGVKQVFVRGEWRRIHDASIITYYNLVFNLRFEELPLPHEEARSITFTIRECEPFMIELGESVSDMIVEDRLISKTGCTEVKLRRPTGSKARERDDKKIQERRLVDRALVSARGTLEALEKLKQLVAVQPPLTSGCTDQELAKQMMRLVYAKIMS